jgi:hypothetical protein
MLDRSDALRPIFPESGWCSGLDQEYAMFLRDIGEIETIAKFE